MKAKFIGKYGSCLLRTGKVYDVEAVNIPGYSLGIKITVLDEVLGTLVPYDTFESFLDNWEVVGMSNKDNKAVYSEADFNKIAEEAKRNARLMFDEQLAKACSSYESTIRTLTDANTVIKHNMADVAKVLASRDRAIEHLAEILYEVTRK